MKMMYTMKKLKYSLILAAALVFGCEQEIADLKPAETPPTPTGTKGSLDITKFVTIGNSLVTGYRSGALYSKGQDESLGKIIAKQLSYAGGSATFNQPDINSENGYYATLAPGVALGRLILFDPDGTGPRSPSPTPSGMPARTVTCPSTVETPAVPAPYDNGNFPGAFTGNKAALNNFGVPGILLAQLLTPLTGGPSTGNPAYNPLYARFASNPGSSTILGDAIAANPTFYLVEIGNNDVLGYATTGASGAIPLTSESDFNTQYNAVINSLLGNLPNAKGVVANIPDVTAIPFFFTVKYNAIPMDQATADIVNGPSGFAGYNAAVEALKHPNFGGAYGSAAELDARKVSFAASATNRILIADKTAVDFGSGWDALVAGGAMTSEDRAKLEPYRKVRQANATDLITLSAGAVLGTCVSNNPLLINGVSVPLADQYVLLPSETLEIKTRTAAFNQIIANAVAGSNNKLALADVNAAFNTFVANKGAVVDGTLLVPSITPPYAAFSEDAVHPNGRGYAYLANIFIDAINAKFGATIPKAVTTQYSGNRTPVSVGNSY
jgi:hypothetical protein